jgi:HlyD family secretion protein
MSRPVKIILWILGLGLVLALSGRSFVSLDSAAPAPLYSLGTVKRGDLNLSVSATGTLSPLITVQVGSQVSGTLEEVYVDFNSQVKKGQEIAQIEPSIFKAKVAQEQANFESTQAASEKAWVAVLDAKRKLERAKQLRSRNMMAESEVDAAQFEYNAALVEHKVQLAAASQAKASLEQAKLNLAHTTIYAPIDGVVLSRDVDIGQTVAASLQAPTLFTIAQDLRRMQIETDVDEAFIGMIQEGQPVRFTVFAYPKEVFTGQLVQIRLNPKVESDVVLYNCIIQVDNTNLKLKPGMTATVTIEVDQRKDILKVPNSALRYVPNLTRKRLKEIREELNVQSNETLIWTPAGNDVKPIKVKVGLTSDQETEINSAKLQDGMKVILSEKGKAASRRHKISLF